MDYLEQETGISVRQISRITAEEQAVTSLDQADKLLVAMGKQYLLGTDEVQIVPNPNWSLEKWLKYQEEMKGDCC